MRVLSKKGRHKVRALSAKEIDSLATTATLRAAASLHEMLTMSVRIGLGGPHGGAAFGVGLKAEEIDQLEKLVRSSLSRFVVPA